MTLKQLMTAAKALNCQVKKTAYGEFRVVVKGQSEATAYYATDASDAYGTMLAMAQIANCDASRSVSLAN